jgi:predicted branched-subunit amino acid permease
MKNEKSRKNGLKVKAIALLFAVFYPFTKKEKKLSKWTKSKGYSLTFLVVFPPYENLLIFLSSKWTKSKH